jgi:sterol 3beta-glucosyltransferase
MVSAAGAGPKPLEIRTLDASALATAIEILLHPSTTRAAELISQKMRMENGVKATVRSFHRNLPVQSMNCNFTPRHLVLEERQTNPQAFPPSGLNSGRA